MIELDNAFIGSEPGEETTMLPEIPVLDVGLDWPFETLEREFERINAMLDEGNGWVPKLAMKIADAVSRRWLERSHYPYLAEIDRIAARIARPGAYFLNLGYEWGCTSSVGPSPDGRSSRLVHVLDWPERGLGRYIIAARIHCDAERLAHPHMAWLHRCAAGHLTRQICRRTQSSSDGAARGCLSAGLACQSVEGLEATSSGTCASLAAGLSVRTRLCRSQSDVIRNADRLAGDLSARRAGPDEACVIERLPDRAHVISGPVCAANAWQLPGWSGRSRGEDNSGRLALMRTAAPSLDGKFTWLQPPILNRRTRLIFIADASSGFVVTQGYEAERPATAVLHATV